MNYHVIWDERAENELTAIWLVSNDQPLITAAVAWLDRHLAHGPLRLGESRGSAVHRVVFRSPIGIEFEVVEDDKRVIVQGVFAIS